MKKCGIEISKISCKNGGNESMQDEAIEIRLKED